MTDDELRTLARHTLTQPEHAVWAAKHLRGLGRRSGSLALGITEEAFRHRLHNADRKMAAAIREGEAA